MTIGKREFLRLTAAAAAALTLAACGGGGDPAMPSSGGGGGSGGGGAGGTGALTIAGTSNFPDAGTNLVPDAGLAAGASLSTTAGNLLNVAINSLVNGNVRFFSLPLGGSAAPAINSSYTIITDGAAGAGSPLALVATNALTAKTYSWSSESGTVKITAISATSVDLLFTNVTFHPTPNTDPAAAFATGKVILNGTVTIPRR